MKRKTCVYALAASMILALGVAPSGGASASARYPHHTSHAERVTACGVERWAVKTGIDPDARLVNQAR